MNVDYTVCAACGSSDHNDAHCPTEDAMTGTANHPNVGNIDEGLREAAARIASLESQLAEANHWRERHSRDAEAYGKQSNENWRKLQAASALLAECERRLLGEACAMPRDVLLAKLRGRERADGYSDEDAAHFIAARDAAQFRRGVEAAIAIVERHYFAAESLTELRNLRGDDDG